MRPGAQRLLESIVFEVAADDPVFLVPAGVIVIAGFATDNARTTFAAITGSQWIVNNPEAIQMSGKSAFRPCGRNPGEFFESHGMGVIRVFA